MCDNLSTTYMARKRLHAILMPSTIATPMLGLTELPATEGRP